MRPPPIPPNPNRSRANVFICVTLLIIGLSISSIIILSLIPVYLEDKSATTSRTGRSARSVDTFDSSQYIFNKSQAKQKQSIEKWYSTSALTLQLILSMQNQLNAMLNDINARVVIIKAFMLSADRLFVHLQINFDSTYTNFRLSQITLMKRALSKAGTVIIYKQYRGNNYYKSKRHTLVVLQTNTNNFNKLFQSIQTTNYLLIQDTDPRQSIQTSKVQPTNCIKMVSNELKYRIVVNRSQDYQFYCFDWIATKSHETFSVSFVFNIGKQQYVYIDDITFNSTSNFIQNGNFERKMENEWSCNNRSCLPNHVKDNPKSGAFSFRTDGSLSLTQLILESIESNTLYQLGFWLKLSCDPTDPCTVVVHIGAQNLSYNSSS